MAVSDKAWDGSSARYKDAAAFCAACLVDTNEPGKPKVAANCRLPVKEPDGSVNRNAVHNAAARINQTSGVSPEEKKAAAKKLVRLYGTLKEDPPAALRRMAGMMAKADKAMNAAIRKAVSR
jgi:hypothetical protein